MSKFTFINEQFDYDEYTGEQRNLVSKTTREFHGHTLDGVLDEMTAFLRGAGYHFDGHLDVVSYESEINKIDDELDDLKEEIRSQRVFDHIVKDLIKTKDEIVITAGATDSSVNQQYSFDFTNHRDNNQCEVCGLSKSVMAIHRCYDDNCPIYAAKN